MSSDGLRIGSATARPGSVAFGMLPVLDLPTGGSEELPIVIAQGRGDGPVVWVTANIHGGELTGLASIHALLTPSLPEQLRGTLVLVPTFNPAGLRVMQRAPYYEAGDPNRTWPDRGTPSQDARPGVYEEIARRLFDQIVATAPTCLLDLHNASIDSVPFIILDRVLYTGGDRAAAASLAERCVGLARAFGISTVNEVPAATYHRRKLNRSVSGSMVNAAGIPALTVELGMGMALDPQAVSAGTQGIINVLRSLEMLPGRPDPITEVPVVQPPYPVRRDDSARAPASGIVQHLVHPGQAFQAGDRLGRMLDIYGRPLDGGDIRAEADGWLIGWSNGIAKYRGQVVASLAVRDDEPLTANIEERDVMGDG